MLTASQTKVNCSFTSFGGNGLQWDVYTDIVE